MITRGSAKRLQAATLADAIVWTGLTEDALNELYSEYEVKKFAKMAANIL